MNALCASETLEAFIALRSVSDRHTIKNFNRTPSRIWRMLEQPKEWT
jgi:hypothetical protein